MLCLRKILVAKTFMEKKGENGLSKFSVEKLLSQRAEKLRRETFSLSLLSGIE